MKIVNKYNLSRTIPETVKRKVRKNSGFGCVICGSAICQYEHIDPEFTDAITHNPKGITLLCGSCHDKKTRGIYGKEFVLESMKNPKCKENGFTFDYLDIGTKSIIIQIGNCTFIDVISLFSVDGVSLFTLIPPNPKLIREPYKLSAYISDNEENGVFGIKENVWYGNIENWDIECIGRKIKIRKKLGDIVLDMEVIPREKIIIHKLEMNYKGYRIYANKSNILIKSPKYEEIIELTEDIKITGQVPFILQDERIYLHKLKIEGGLLHLKKGFASHCFIENYRIGYLTGTDHCTIGTFSSG